MKISRLGEAPDYRFSLANERTFLAWIRTALGFLAAGVGLDQLAPDFATPVIRELLALLLCLFSGGLAMYGYLRWLRNEKAMRLKEDLPYTNSLLIISLILMVVAVIVMGLVLYAGWPQSQTHCRPRTAAGAHITGVVSYHAGLRRVDGVGYQTQLAPGGHVILDFDWHSRHRGADPLALHP